MRPLSQDVKFIIWGILFAILWSSASVAAKIGVQSMEPLVLFQFRFILAGALLLIYSYFFEDWKLPNIKEFIELAIFGFLNVTLYLSLFVLAITEVTAGIGSLSTSLGPLLMTILGGLIFGKKTKMIHFLGLFLGFFGVYIAVIPLLGNSNATPRGLILLLFSMLSYSVASLYYASKKWSLTRFALNGWQVLLGGIFMLPLTIFFNKKPVIMTLPALLSIAWLIGPVSILAVNIWLKLIKIDTIKASFFLFLCPIFGFIFSSLFLNEPFTVHTVIGLIFVLCALMLGKK